MPVFNRPIRILLVTNGVVLVASWMLAPIYALFVEEIGGSLLDASFTIAAFAVAGAITNLVIGRFVDRFKEDELIVVVGYVLMAIGFASLTLVSSVWHLVAVQALIGFAESLYSPAYNALFTSHTSKKKVGREWGSWEATNNVAIAVGAVVGGLIAHTYGFQMLFIAMAAVALFSALYMYRLPRRVL